MFGFGVKFPFVFMFFDEGELIGAKIFAPQFLFLHFFVLVKVHLLEQGHLILLFNHISPLLCLLSFNYKIGRSVIALLLLLSLSALLRSSDLVLQLSF